MIRLASVGDAGELMTDWKKSFLESSVLGQSTNKCCPSEVIIKCIELAYSDMMTAGRYYSASFLNDKKEICSATNSAITESNFVFSRKIIKDIVKTTLVLNKINIFDGNMRAVQVCKIDLIFVLCQPVPDSCLIFRSV